VNQENSEQNEVDGMKKGADSTGKVMHYAYVKERLVTCNEEDTDGRARVTRDKERVLQSNPIFIVKTQLTERSRITDKHSENHIKKHREH